MEESEARSWSSGGSVWEFHIKFGWGMQSGDCGRMCKRGSTDNSEQIAGSEELLDGLIELCSRALVAMVPPLHGRRAADGAKEKAGHSGRDDREEKGKCKSTARNGCATGAGLFVGEGFDWVDAGGSEGGDGGAKRGAD